MPPQFAHLTLRDQTTRRKPVPESIDERELLGSQSDIVGLQRLVGNRGVQTLLAQGRVNQIGAKTSLTPAAAPSVQRCGCGGSCATCKGSVEEEVGISTSAGNELQRWWDDDESESDGDDGGSWLDDAADWASDTAGDIADWASGGSSGGSSSGSQSSDSGGSESDSDDGGSWLDDVADWASDTAGGIADWASDTWNDWTGGGEDESSEGEDEPLIEEDTGGAPGNLPSVAAVNADCLTDEAVGFGGGGGRTISLHGRTNANFNHGRPIPAPFPDGVTVTTRSSKAGNAFDAVGSFDVTFDANTSVTLPPVPSDLTPCQDEAVRNFINGPLAAHEQDHVSAFRDNYDGTFTADVNVHNIADTPANRQNAMQNPVNQEDLTRAAAARTASAALDPWNQTIPGLDCVEPEAEGEESEDSE